MPREYEQLYDIINVSKFNKYMSDRIGRTLLLMLVRPDSLRKQSSGNYQLNQAKVPSELIVFFHAECLLADLKELAKNRKKTFPVIGMKSSLMVHV